MYSGTQITILILLLTGSIIGLSYIFAQRQTTNFFMKILPKYKKRYVVCHLRYPSGMEDIYNVVPDLKGLTQVGKYSYALFEKYVTLTYRKRKHFVLDEANTIPRHFEQENKEDIIFQAAEIQTALDNTVMEYLFSKKKELLILGLFILAIIAIIVIAYNVYEIQKIGSYIESLQAIPPIKEVR